MVYSYFTSQNSRSRDCGFFNPLLLSIKRFFKLIRLLIDNEINEDCTEEEVGFLDVMKDYLEDTRNKNQISTKQ